MKNYGVIRGSVAQAKPLIVNVDTVYVHSNIKEVTDEEGNIFYEYNEIQYNKDEYIELISKQLENTENALCEIDETTTKRMAAIEDALCEIDLGGTTV